MVMAMCRQAERMFLVHCPTCGHRELRSFSALLGVTNEEHGIVLTFGCSNCGATVRSVTGRSAVPPAAASHHAAA